MVFGATAIAATQILLKKKMQQKYSIYSKEQVLQPS